MLQLVTARLPHQLTLFHLFRHHQGWLQVRTESTYAAAYYAAFISVVSVTYTAAAAQPLGGTILESNDIWSLAAAEQQIAGRALPSCFL